jgi:hypothetical protein
MSVRKLRKEHLLVVVEEVDQRTRIKERTLRGLEDKEINGDF